MIAVLDYGIGNLRSAQKALQRVGAEARLVTAARDAAGASAVVLPGVGAFGACATALREQGLDVPVREALAAGRPVLGLCVGFQLFFEASEESPGARGLGLIEGTLRRLPAGVKRPQMQWNLTSVVEGRSSRLLGGPDAPPSWFYYVHSYAALAGDLAGAHGVATCEYGASVVAVVERDGLYGTQFHPEKSGTAGLALLERFVSLCGEHGGGAHDS